MLTMSISKKVDNIFSEIEYYQSVIVLNAGGTINMKGVQSRGSGDSVANILLPIQSISHQYIELFNPPPDSSAIGSKEWSKMLDVVQDIMNKKLLIREKIRNLGMQSDIGGIVITHGTDTMEYSSFVLALQLSLQEVPCPIIFTGSHSPPDQISSDAELNLRKSINLAAPSYISAFGNLTQKLANKVYILIGTDLHLASRIKKINTEPDKEGIYFKSYPDLAGKVIGENRLRIFIEFKNISFVPEQFPFQSNGNFGYVEHIVVDKNTPVKIFEDAAQRIIKMKNRKQGLIVQGDMSRAKESNLNEIRNIFTQLGNLNVIVVVGSLKFWKKISSPAIVLLPKSLCYSKARTKLSWILRHDISVEDAKNWLCKDQAGECTDMPPWTAYETFSENNYLAGKEVILVYPDIHWKVFADAIDRLLSQNSDKKKKKELIIWGLGSGHIPVKTGPLKEIISESLRIRFPDIYNTLNNSDRWLSENLDYRKIRDSITEFFQKDKKRDEVIKIFRINNACQLAEYMINRFMSQNYKNLLKKHKITDQIGRELQKLKIPDENLRYFLENSYSFLMTHKKIAGKFTKYCVNQINKQEPKSVHMILQDIFGQDLINFPAGSSLNELKQNLKESILYNSDKYLEKLPPHFANLFAERIMQDALKEWDPILAQIARATDAGIHLEIRTTVPKAKSDCRLYEVGNMLLILGANSDMTKGWRGSPLCICDKI